MQFQPGDLVECGGDTARVVEDLGDRLRVEGARFGERIQTWFTDIPECPVWLVHRPAEQKQQRTIEATDPGVRPEDRKRLRGQSEQILRRLREGPATNRELAAIAMKYTSRLSDIRAAGYVVECQRLTGGLAEYTLQN